MGRLSLGRMAEPSALPVWVWRTVMGLVEKRQVRRFNRHVVDGVARSLDIDYAGDGAREHRLDVLMPDGVVRDAPVYVYFHGGGWTSGDKAATDRYCASQAAAGFVVVNANYRLAHRCDEYHMRCMVEDACRVLAWGREHARRFGGDPERIVVGGDSAGGQLAALTVATMTRPELAEHFGVAPAVPSSSVRGVVQHSSFADISLASRKGSLALGFVRILLPGRGRGLAGPAFREAAHYLSPVEWVSAGFPATFVSSSARDFLRRASGARRCRSIPRRAPSTMPRRAC